jgi:hypothetical protein
MTEIDAKLLRTQDKRMDTSKHASMLKLRHMMFGYAHAHASGGAGHRRRL